MLPNRSSIDRQSPSLQVIPNERRQLCGLQILGLSVTFMLLLRFKTVQAGKTHPKILAL